MDIGIGRFFSRIKPAISSRDIAGEALLVLIVIELVTVRRSVSAHMVIQLVQMEKMEQVIATEILVDTVKNKALD